VKEEENKYGYKKIKKKKKLNISEINISAVICR
jgi:hypothetical protein